MEWKVNNRLVKFHLETLTRTKIRPFENRHAENGKRKRRKAAPTRARRIRGAPPGLSVLCWGQSRSRRLTAGHGHSFKGITDNRVQATFT
ncbi:unnamed protein product [Oikopleura dioica]|uniref:Uncharacterized protein n=1 Tax=Oikopleura dioica TaxID=34765 RepID=E4Y5T9_OIKDI|nr:unnamed protein product [Oikopleura dioica]